MIYTMEMSGAPTTVTTTTVVIGPGEPTLSVGIDDSDRGTFHRWTHQKNYLENCMYRRCAKCGISFVDDEWVSLGLTVRQILASSCAGTVVARKEALATLAELQ